MLDAFLRLYNIPFKKLSATAKCFHEMVQVTPTEAVSLFLSFSLSLFLSFSLSLFLSFSLSLFLSFSLSLLSLLFRLTFFQKKKQKKNLSQSEKITFSKIVSELCVKPLLSEYVQNMGRKGVPCYEEEAVSIGEEEMEEW